MLTPVTRPSTQPISRTLAGRSTVDVVPAGRGRQQRRIQHLPGHRHPVAVLVLLRVVVLDQLTVGAEAMPVGARRTAVQHGVQQPEVGPEQVAGPVPGGLLRPERTGPGGVHHQHPLGVRGQRPGGAGPRDPAADHHDVPVPADHGRTGRLTPEPASACPTRPGPVRARLGLRRLDPVHRDEHLRDVGPVEPDAGIVGDQGAELAELAQVVLDLRVLQRGPQRGAGALPVDLGVHPVRRGQREADQVHRLGFLRQGHVIVERGRDLRCMCAACRAGSP